MNLTPGRRAWLERLAHEGIGRRPRGRVGYDCMRAGWTEWACRDRETGEIVGTDALVARYAARGVPWNRYEMVGEMLTAAGREAIRPPKPSLLGRLFPHYAR